VTTAALLFPGQGAQSVGMVGDWCDGLPRARDLFATARDVLGYDLEAICRGGPKERLDTTAVSQPALLVTSLAALELLETRDDSPLGSVAAVAGLSLGEYTALVFAGALDPADAIRVVAERGKAMQECADRHPGVMIAVLGLERAAVASLCDEARGGEVLSVANVLCPGNVVVSGTRTACERLEPLATAAGAMKCVRLDVAGAFHTPLMESAVARLSEALAGVEIRPPRVPVVSNVDARVHDDPEEIRGLLARQVCGVVEWNASMDLLLGMGVERFWEVGPGRVLRGLLKRISRSAASNGVPE